MVGAPQPARAVPRKAPARPAAACDQRVSGAHQILGLPPGAGPEQIRRAFRRRALELHPDHNPGDPEAAERFRRVHAAYAALRAGAEPFEPLAERAAAVISTLYIPLSTAICGGNVTVSAPGGPTPVTVPACCGEGIVLEAPGCRVRIAHLLPARFRRDGADLICAAEAGEEGGPGLVRIAGADEQRLEMRLGPEPPRRIRLEGAGAPLAGRIGPRGDLVLVISPRPMRAETPREQPRQQAGRPGRIVDALV